MVDRQKVLDWQKKRNYQYEETYKHPLYGTPLKEPYQKKEPPKSEEQIIEEMKKYLDKLPLKQAEILLASIKERLNL